MERYQRALTELSGATERRVVDLWRQVEAGETTRRQFELSAATIIGRSDARAARLADVALAASLFRMLSQTVPPAGVTPDVDQSVIRDALGQVIDEDIESADTPEQLDESRRARVGRLARNEPLVTAAGVLGGLMASRGLGWTRRTDPDPCPLCISWADGVVRPGSTRMARHVGCSCVQQPAQM